MLCFANEIIEERRSQCVSYFLSHKYQIMILKKGNVSYLQNRSIGVTVCEAKKGKFKHGTIDPKYLPQKCFFR
jgi:hypothetical protein